MKPSTQILGG